jgi:phosphatidylinositol alpha 1,6-mannosyltransferase
MLLSQGSVLTRYVSHQPPSGGVRTAASNSLPERACGASQRMHVRRQRYVVQLARGPAKFELDSNLDYDLGEETSRAMGWMAEGCSLQLLRALYSQAAMVMAPNQELIELTRQLTDRPVHRMRRGVDTSLFHPAKRTRAGGRFRIGYVGRLTPEKNVRLLAQLDRESEIVIVGEGHEEGWLREQIPNAIFSGVLRGETLAKAYADLDLFAFPSRTDTFGNVILEALASGVPCVVTNSGGPKFLIAEGVTGHVARDDGDFVDFAAALAHSPARRQTMSAAARTYAVRQSWDAVFEALFDAYASCVPVECAA